MMIRKLITIRPDQSDYLDENSISLSRFVQRKIDEDMIINIKMDSEKMASIRGIE